MTDYPPGVLDEAGWDLLQEIDSAGEGLTPWEIDFVESVTKQLKDNRYLTDKQWQVLRNIEEKRCQ